MTAKVGWFIYSTWSGYKWYEGIGIKPQKLNHTAYTANSEARFCPAIHNIFKNTWEIQCPFDLHLSCSVNDDGFANVTVHDDSTLRPEKFNDIFFFNPIRDRVDGKVMIQMNLPLVLVTDDDIDMEILPPLLKWNDSPIRYLGGRWNIKNWNRPMNWIFDWQDINRDLYLKRGDPLFYIRLYAKDRDEKVKLVELDRNDKLESIVNQTFEIKNYVTHNYANVMKEYGNNRGCVFSKFDKLRFWK